MVETNADRRCICEQIIRFATSLITLERAVHSLRPREIISFNVLIFY